MSDTIETLGKILPPGTQVGKRDAIHIPVLAAKAGNTLFANQAVIYQDGTAYSPDNTDATPIGIVDPFLTEMVPQGKMFWVFLYPGTVTDLTHAWEHPAIPEIGGSEAKTNDRIKEAEEYIKAWADTEGLNYEDLIDAVRQELKPDGTIEYDYIYLKDLSSSATIEDPKVFWKHMSYLMGVYIKTNITYFSCSC